MAWERRENKKGSPGSGCYSRLSTLAGPDPYEKVPRAKVFVLSVLECKSLVEYTGSVYDLYKRRKDDSRTSGTLGLGWEWELQIHSGQNSEHSGHRGPKYHQRGLPGGSGVWEHNSPTVNAQT